MMRDPYTLTANPVNPSCGDGDHSCNINEPESLLQVQGRTRWPRARAYRLGSATSSGQRGLNLKPPCKHQDDKASLPKKFPNLLAHEPGALFLTGVAGTPDKVPLRSALFGTFAVHAETDPAGTPQRWPLHISAHHCGS